MYQEITHRELETLVKNHENIELIDVREQKEHDMIRIPGAKLIPLSVFASRAHEIDYSRPVYIFCRTGGRSGQACTWLETQGKRAINVSGSIKSLYDVGSSILEITNVFNPVYLQ
jgi:rhodanese-related sulfurtransferase